MSAISKPRHSPKRVYALIKKAQREAVWILKAEFYIDPEAFEVLVRGVVGLMEMAMDTQERLAQRQTARELWKPTFERAVMLATGIALADFLPSGEAVSQ